MNQESFILIDQMPLWHCLVKRVLAELLKWWAFLNLIVYCFSSKNCCNVAYLMETMCVCVWCSRWSWVNCRRCARHSTNILSFVMHNTREYSIASLRSHSHTRGQRDCSDAERKRGKLPLAEQLAQSLGDRLKQMGKSKLMVWWCCCADVVL